MNAVAHTLTTRARASTSLSMSAPEARGPQGKSMTQP